MKVSEAKEKVCPFIVQAKNYAWANHRVNLTEIAIDGVPANIKCICNNCIAWIPVINTETKEYDSGYCARIGQ